jgi:hypothetical protein
VVRAVHLHRVEDRTCTCPYACTCTCTCTTYTRNCVAGPRGGEGIHVRRGQVRVDARSVSCHAARRRGVPGGNLPRRVRYTPRNGLSGARCSTNAARIRVVACRQVCAVCREGKQIIVADIQQARRLRGIGRC